MAAGRRSRRPGPRRGRALPDRTGCHRRPVRSVRARQIPGLFGAVFGLSVLVGPAIGGIFAPDTVGWSYVFFINLPIGAAVFFAVWKNLPAYHLGGDRPKIDYLGAVLFTAALVPILVGLTNKSTAEWTDPAVSSLIAVGALILALFVF